MSKPEYLELISSRGKACAGQHVTILAKRHFFPIILSLKQNLNCIKACVIFIHILNLN